jgi:hypothetical protein
VRGEQALGLALVLGERGAEGKRIHRGAAAESKRRARGREAPAPAR